MTKGANQFRLLRKFMMLAVLSLGLYLLPSSAIEPTAMAKICQQTCESNYQTCMAHIVSTCGSDVPCQNTAIDNCFNLYDNCSSGAEWCDPPESQGECTRYYTPPGRCCWKDESQAYCDHWETVLGVTYCAHYTDYLVISQYCNY